MIPGLATDDMPDARIDRKRLGVVGVLVAGQAAEDGLSKQP